MNGQPMPPPQSGGAENRHKEGLLNEDAALRWAAYTEGIKTNRASGEQETGEGGAQSSEQGASAEAPPDASKEGAASSSVAPEVLEGLHTPQAAKSAAFVSGDTPGPAPMSGMSFAGDFFSCLQYCSPYA